MGDLQKLFNPTTIAVIGATEKEGTFGRGVLENVLTSGDRKVYPVNPNRETVLGNPCWSEIGAVPGPVDLAIIATPAATVPAVVDACGRAGVEGLIIIAAGFREAGAEGRRLEEEILRINKAYGMRIVGPNCLGIMRPPVNLNATFLRENPEAGNIAFISDAGSFGRTLLDWGISSHIGFSMVVSLGSAIDVDFGDVIEYLADDPHTKSIILYMEEVVGNVKRFVSAVRGFARYKPVILLKPPILVLEDGDYVRSDPLGRDGPPGKGLRCPLPTPGRCPGPRGPGPLQRGRRPVLPQSPPGLPSGNHTNANGIGIIAAKQLLNFRRPAGRALRRDDHQGHGRLHPPLLEPEKSRPYPPQCRYPPVCGGRGDLPEGSRGGRAFGHLYPPGLRPTRGAGGGSCRSGGQDGQAPADGLDGGAGNAAGARVNGGERHPRL